MACSGSEPFSRFGTTYEHDVIIRLSGEVARRKKKLSKKYYGTSHVLSKDEARFVFENGCQQLILGSGQMGNVHLSPEAEAYFAKKGCAVLLQPTPKAIHTFNGSHAKDRPFSRYLQNRAGRDCAAADEQNPESALRTSIGRTLVRAAGGNHHGLGAQEVLTALNRMSALSTP
jgi:hypothetical protein